MTENKTTTYPHINMQETGERLRRIARSEGYSVADLQEYLHLSCPQPIYRWFQGKVLPSVDHLYMLSLLFEIHMEELIVPARKPLRYGMDIRVNQRNYMRVRLQMYAEQLNCEVA